MHRRLLRQRHHQNVPAAAIAIVMTEPPHQRAADDHIALTPALDDTAPRAEPPDLSMWRRLEWQLRDGSVRGLDHRMGNTRRAIRIPNLCDQREIRATPRLSIGSSTAGMKSGARLAGAGHRGPWRRSSDARMRALPRRGHGCGALGCSGHPPSRAKSSAGQGPRSRFATMPRGRLVSSPAATCMSCALGAARALRIARGSRRRVDPHHRPLVMR